MADLAFAALDELGLRTIESWFADTELGRRYNCPTLSWLEHVRSEPGVHAWSVHESGKPVGLLQLHTEPGRMGYVGLVVRPDLRNQGYGRRILRALLAREEARGLERIVAKSESDNLGSHRCASAAGFVQQSHEPDEEGFLTFVYTVAGMGC